MVNVKFESWVHGVGLRQAALIAGLTYLLNPVTFAEAYAMPRLVVADPTQTIVNLHAHPLLFAMAILSYFFSLLGDVVCAWALYILLAPVNRALSLLAALLQLVYAAMSLAAVSSLGALYRLLSVPDYASHIDPADLLHEVPLLIGSFRSGWGLALILFGFHLVAIGWLMARSTYLPRWLGLFLILDGSVWVVNNLSVYLFPNASLDFLNICYLAELVFMIWLLGFGCRLRKPAGPAEATA